MGSSRVLTILKPCCWVLRSISKDFPKETTRKRIQYGVRLNVFYYFFCCNDVFLLRLQHFLLFIMGL